MNVITLRAWFRKIVTILLNPYFTGVYVLTAIASVTMLSLSCLGYGSNWPANALLVLLGSLMATTVILSTRVQWWVWKKLGTAEDPTSRIPLGRAVCYSILILVTGVALGGFVGEGCRTFRAWRICRECQPLLDDLNAYQRDHGTYPNEIESLRSYQSLVKQRRIYLVQQPKADEQLQWYLDDLDRSAISLFVLPERVQCIVPIQHAALFSFSHFRVYVFDSSDKKWRRTLMHWSLLGAFID